MARLASLLAITCLGSAGTLLAGRAAQGLLPVPNPDTPAPLLTALERWALDPALRREASLLLAARSADDPRRQHRLLRAQGWGRDPLAALVLKRDAEALTALGDQPGAEQLWRQLGQRFPVVPAAADALYVLGRSQPGLHRQLRRQFPAHPAALAAAQEAGDGEAALHLARWGVRWPGAEERMRERCGSPTPPLQPRERDQLAAGLAQLGDGVAALACLHGQSPGPASQLAIARSLLHDTPDRASQAESLLLQLAQRQTTSPEASEAVRLLSESTTASSQAALAQLPPALQQSAPVSARRALASRSHAAALAVLKRWPGDPASWELQWQLAREALLQGQWQQAITLLAEPRTAAHQPPLLASRRLFWLGLSRWQLGQPVLARQQWQRLLQVHPGGYYGWRAAERLGLGRLSLVSDQPARPRAGAPGPSELVGGPWRPLQSGDAELDRLWRLDQPLEAWEHWRYRRQGRPPQVPRELQLEGRLRRAVGDHWIGLGQLEQASLRVPPTQCRLAKELEQDLHEPAFGPELGAAARASGIRATVLAAVAKQESRFSPTVRSAVGAVGLMQLMPETANELAGQPLAQAALEDPHRNAALGARYLSQLLQRWRGHPLLAIASYNAGPGAVAGWVTPQLHAEPELWVEAIPFPETRLYVKKVAGNAWSFQQPRHPRCWS